MTREVITFQFGNYSNYIGAHYWNIQENQFVYSTDANKKEIPDVNHDVLFREGLNIQNRLTYTPRMMLFDLKDNINVFKSANQPIEESKAKPDVTTWKGNLQVFESEPKEKSQYSIDTEKNEIEEINWENSKNRKHMRISHLKDHYEMDDQVKYWSDYMKVKYNDRSYNLINQYQTATKDTEPFDLFNYGVNVFSENGFFDTFEDNLRHFGEECDQIQGFQFFVDSFNGFGGMAHQALNLINEEYPKHPIFSILSYPFFNDQAKDVNTQKLINSAFTLKSLLTDKSDMLLLPLSIFDSFFMSKELKPIQLPSVNYRADLNYHTSSILAALIDSITLPWRQKSQKTSMNDIVELFNVNKYNISSLRAVCPLQLYDKYLFDYLQESDLIKNSTSFTPFCSESSFKTETSSLSGAFTITCRGVEDRKVKNPRDCFYFKSVVPAFSILDRYSIEMYPKSRSIQTPLNVNMPFPGIIKNDQQNLSLNLKGVSNDISLITILQVNKSIFNFLKFMSDQMDKVNISKQIKYFENGMEYDDFVELISFNKELCDIYSI